MDRPGNKVKPMVDCCHELYERLRFLVWPLSGWPFYDQLDDRRHHGHNSPTQSDALPAETGRQHSRSAQKSMACLPEITCVHRTRSRVCWPPQCAGLSPLNKPDGSSRRTGGSVSNHEGRQQKAAKCEDIKWIIITGPNRTRNAQALPSAQTMNDPNETRRQLGRARRLTNLQRRQ